MVSYKNDLKVSHSTQRLPTVVMMLWVAKNINLESNWVKPQGEKLSCHMVLGDQMKSTPKTSSSPEILATSALTAEGLQVGTFRAIPV